MAPMDLSNCNLAVIAGNGLLPYEIFNELKSKGHPPLLIGVAGEISDRLCKTADHVLTFGQIGTLFEILKTHNISHVVFAGGITKRPDYTALKLDMLTIKELPTLLKIGLGGDNSVLEKISDYFLKKNISVLGAHEIVPDLLTPSNVLVGKINKKTVLPMAMSGFKAAKQIGALDAGQAVIIEDGRLIALEGAEGTDAMIMRVAELRQAGRISAKPKMSLLVKVMKPEQDMRADLPSIGPDTIHHANASGIKGMVLEAGRSFILDRQETIDRAKSCNMFIMGIDETMAIQ